MVLCVSGFGQQGPVQLPERETEKLNKIGTAILINHEVIIEKYSAGNSKIILSEHLDSDGNFDIKVSFFYKNGDLKAFYEWVVFEPFKLNKSTRFYRYRNGQLAYYNSFSTRKSTTVNYSISGEKIEDSSYRYSFKALKVSDLIEEHSKVYEKKNLKDLP